MIAGVETASLAPVLADLGIPAERAQVLGIPAGTPAEEVVRRAPERIGPDGSLLVLLQGDLGDPELASWRNALWPLAHVGALYRLSPAGIERRTLQGRQRVDGTTSARGVLLAAHKRENVLSPDATVAKFDQNAAGWDGDPKSPSYPHHRWMRRFVAEFAGAERLANARKILDFGSGAGWVGIEAALQAPRATLFAFDPSPEMIRLAGENARASGVARFEARTGFGEDPPFPGPFDLVISSGVWSFAPDAERWIDGLARTVAPGGTLVFGDIHRDSKGMRRRRAEKPLLPAREMNARTRDEARTALERRGFRFEAWAGYQLTSPVPEIRHFSEKRLGGLLNPALLAWNRASAARDLRGGARNPDRFDSWVVRFVRP
ncbi:MAG: class I SAM-dependent methyltransferase [Planctomycetota bacterium]